MANNNVFGGLDMNAFLNSGIDLSVLNSLSQAQQQRPPMPMQGQGPPPQNMGGMQGMNMGMAGNGGMQQQQQQQQQQNMAGNGMRNMQQPNNGMTSAQLLDAFTRMQATQMAQQQLQNRGGTPTMGAAPQLNRMPSNQFPGGQPQQQQQGDQNSQYQQLHRLVGKFTHLSEFHIANKQFFV
jgi:hypothetical protein